MNIPIQSIVVLLTVACVIYIGIQALVIAQNIMKKDVDAGFSPLKSWRLYFSALVLFALVLVLAFGGSNAAPDNEYNDSPGMVKITNEAGEEKTKEELRKEALDKKEKLLKRVEQEGFEEEKQEADDYLKHALKNR